MPLPSAAPSYIAPTSATAGETLVWRVRAPDTPPADGWACQVTLRALPGGGEGQQTAARDALTIAAAVVDGDFQVTVTAAQTASLGDGRVRWTALAKRNDEAYKLAAGEFALDPLDGITQLERRLAALDDAIYALAQGGIQEYTIGDRTVRHAQLPDLRKERSRLAFAAQRAGGRINGITFGGASGAGWAL